MARGKKFDLSALPIKVVYVDEPVRMDALRESVIDLLSCCNDLEPDLQEDVDI